MLGREQLIFVLLLFSKPGSYECWKCKLLIFCGVVAWVVQVYIPRVWAYVVCVLRLFVHPSLGMEPTRSNAEGGDEPPSTRSVKVGLGSKESVQCDEICPSGGGVAPE